MRGILMKENNLEPENFGEEGFENSNNASTNHLRAEILSYLQDIVHTLAVILLVFLLLFRIVVVSGPSMKDTLVDGDYVLLVNNIFYRNQQPGDIIVASKESFREGEPIIKRIIATEGQTVDINFEEGLVYVDGVLQDEGYISSPTMRYEGVNFPLEVAEGCVFVMGDNRMNSMDSRSGEIGQIDTRQILGKAVLIAFPGKDATTNTRQFDRIGGLS